MTHEVTIMNHGADMNPINVGFLSSLKAEISCVLKNKMSNA